MDQDDPEERIADLERQLAERRAASDPGANRGSQQGAFPPPPQTGFPPPPPGRSALTTGGYLTPEQVRNMAFSKPPLGRRGYNKAEVDAFLDLVEAALQDPTGRTLTPEQIRNMAFSKPPLGRRGYNEDDVDAFLDRVEAALVGPSESDTFGMGEESAASGEPIRCLLQPYPSPWKPFKKRQPPLVIDVGKDAIWVSDPNTNALIASAALAQMTATPSECTIDYDERREDVFFGGDTYHHVKYARPYLVLRAPGVQPLFITLNAMSVSPGGCPGSRRS